MRYTHGYTLRLCPFFYQLTCSANHQRALQTDGKMAALQNILLVSAAFGLVYAADVFDTVIDDVDSCRDTCDKTYPAHTYENVRKVQCNVIVVWLFSWLLWIYDLWHHQLDCFEIEGCRSTCIHVLFCSLGGVGWCNQVVVEFLVCFNMEIFLVCSSKIVDRTTSSFFLLKKFFCFLGFSVRLW